MVHRTTGTKTTFAIHELFMLTASFG